MNIEAKRNELVSIITEEDIRFSRDLVMIQENCGIEVVRALIKAFPTGISEIRIPQVSKLDNAVKRYFTQPENRNLSQREISLILNVDRRTIAKILS